MPLRAFQNTLISGVLNLLACSIVADNAFKGCVSLETINMPLIAKESQLGDYVFAGCTSLKSVSLSTAFSLLGNGVFQNCTSLETIGDDAKLTKVGAYAFQNCVSLKQLDMSTAWVSIGDYAFDGCSNLSQVTGSMESNYPIGYSAFRNCQKLQSITWGYIYDGDDLEYVDYVFQSCYSLSKFIIPAGAGLFTISYTWFYSTPMTLSSYLGYFGSIYVPNTMLASFKNLKGWSYYSARMVGYTPSE